MGIKLWMVWTFLFLYVCGVELFFNFQKVSPQRKLNNYSLDSHLNKFISSTRTFDKKSLPAGFPVDIIHQLLNVDSHALPARLRSIYFDHGATAQHDLNARQALNALMRCPTFDESPMITVQSSRLGRFLLHGQRERQQYWQTITQHQLAIVTDTSNIWETLLLGTIPIIKRGSDLDDTILAANLPIVMVRDWPEVCTLTANPETHYRLIQRYQHWMESRAWINPEFWKLSANEWESICQKTLGCQEGPFLTSAADVEVNGNGSQ